MTRIACGRRAIGARVFVFAVAVVCSLPVAGKASLHTAEKALSLGNYAAALEILKPLAKQGNPQAQFRLGKLYYLGQGVEANAEKAFHWFHLAAENGCPPAREIFGLDVDGALPGFKAFGGEPSLKKRRAWVLKQNPQHFTIQLFAGRNEQATQEFIERHNLDDRAGYFASNRGGRPWYSLIYGLYRNLEDAQATAGYLKDVLPKSSPWIRSFASIHKELSAR